jgi:hypothetical protein
MSNFLSAQTKYKGLYFGIRPSLISQQLGGTSSIIKDFSFNNVGFAIGYKKVGLTYDVGLYSIVPNFDTLDLMKDNKTYYLSNYFGASVRLFNSTKRTNFEFLIGLNATNTTFLRRINPYFGASVSFDFYRGEFLFKKKQHFFAASLFVKTIFVPNQLSTTKLNLYGHFGVSVEFSKLLIKEE